MIDLESSGFLEILVVTALAIIGKVGGTALTARLVGDSWAPTLSLGALVQANGLMGLIVLTILLDRGVITADVFSALVLTGVLTTVLAMPLVRIAQRYALPDPLPSRSERAIAGELVHTRAD